MYSGLTFRPRPSTLARLAFASVAVARADESRVRISANRRSNRPNGLIRDELRMPMTRASDALAERLKALHWHDEIVQDAERSA
ncbi:hypothetical protein [Paraburkholderia ultramafica]|nr:hypothetical protein [Paraburkholderia ultramafica]